MGFSVGLGLEAVGCAVLCSGDDLQVAALALRHQPTRERGDEAPIDYRVLAGALTCSGRGSELALGVLVHPKSQLS